MKHLAILLAAALAASPALSQQAAPPPPPPPPEGEVQEGLNLLEQGARRLFEGLIGEVAPQLDLMQREMDRMAGELGPVLRDLVGMIDDLRNYEAPVRLPNGDIILRRKPGAPLPPDLRDKGAEIEI